MGKSLCSFVEYHSTRTSDEVDTEMSLQIVAKAMGSNRGVWEESLLFAERERRFRTDSYRRRRAMLTFQTEP